MAGENEINHFNQVVEKQTGKKKTDAITAIILIACSAYIITNSLKMPFSSEYGPGPGMFPLIMGILLAILSFALLWDGINPKKMDKASKFQNKRGLLASGLMVFGLIGYVIINH